MGCLGMSVHQKKKKHKQKQKQTITAHGARKQREWTVYRQSSDACCVHMLFFPAVGRVEV